jgi:hypothetical protein
MNEQIARVFREVITSGGRNFVVHRPSSPIDHDGTEDGASLFGLDMNDPRLSPENWDKADGAPLRIFDSPDLKVDLSKRSREDMGFWHRSADFNELIVCFRGALRWETELGTTTLLPGQMIWIPKGIAHRSMLCEQSEELNILLELKVRDHLDPIALEPQVS